MPRTYAKAPNQPGAPTARYSNRTDLAAKSAAGMETPTQPVRVPTGQGYGEATALAQAQQAAPLPQPAEVPTGPAPQMMPGTTTPMAAQGYTPPNLGLGSMPTGRPNEPLTSGLGVGPGAGPSPGSSPFNAGALLAALAAATGDLSMSELADLADEQGF